MGSPVHGVVMNEKRSGEAMPFDSRESIKLKPGNAPGLTIQYNTIPKPKPVACSKPFTMKDAAKSAFSQMKKTVKENYGEVIFVHI